MAYGEYDEDMYHWGTLFGTSQTIMTISMMAFIVALANCGFFAASLGISIFTAVVFRQISKLPPDMNPLEEDSDKDSNLTARPHKRTKSEVIEKHLSAATVDSTDPLMGSPRTIPFSHTRGDSQATLTSSSGLDTYGGRYRTSHGEEAETAEAGHGNDSVTDYYMHRSPSPVSERSKSPSSLYSRTTTGTSTTTAFKDWMSSSARGRSSSPAKKRGEYSLTTTQECDPVDENNGFQAEAENNKTSNTMYGSGGDDVEGDLGNQLLGVYEEQNRAKNANARYLMNPLGMNPPTPQPPRQQQKHMSSETPRSALSDVHNFSHLNRMSMPPLVKDLTLKGKGYEQLRNGLDIHIPLDPSIDGANTSDGIQVGKRRSPSAKRRAAKRSIFGSVDEKSDDEELDEADTAILAPSDRDRRGRVVSNSGVDLHGSGNGLSPSAYGNYIAGMGVGRRRDVSGKIAEEGRSIGDNNGYYYEKDSTGFGLRQPSGLIRAPGWSRFAGY